jgi:hypothetical protein
MRVTDIHARVCVCDTHKHTLATTACVSQTYTYLSMCVTHTHIHARTCVHARTCHMRTHAHVHTPKPYKTHVHTPKPYKTPTLTQAGCLCQLVQKSSVPRGPLHDFPQKSSAVSGLSHLISGAQSLLNSKGSGKGRKSVCCPKDQEKDAAPKKKKTNDPHAQDCGASQCTLNK